MKKLILITVLCLFTLQCEQGWLKDILIPVIEGCTDSTACNYNSDATDDDGSCTHADTNHDCSGACMVELDCNGFCGGTDVVDCAGNCGGNAVEDNCGTCDNNVENDCTEDCFGVEGGTAQIDDCDVCGGNNSTCTDCNGSVNGTAYLDGCGDCVGGTTGLSACPRDCAGVDSGAANYNNCGTCICNGSTPPEGYSCVESEECVQGCDGIWKNDGTHLVLDECTVCGGDNLTCTDCNGDLNGGAVLDECEVCGGDGSSCTPPNAIYWGPCTIGSASCINGSEIHLDWGYDVDSDFSRYEIIRNDEVIITITNSETHIYTDTPIQGHDYTYKVRVYDTGGLYSETGEYIVSASDFYPPEPNISISYSGGSVTVSSDCYNISDLQKINILRKNSINSEAEIIHTITISDVIACNPWVYSDNTISTPDTRYWYETELFDTAGLSTKTSTPAYISFYDEIIYLGRENSWNGNLDIWKSEVDGYNAEVIVENDNFGGGFGSMSISPSANKLIISVYPTNVYLYDLSNSNYQSLALDATVGNTVWVDDNVFVVEDSESNLIRYDISNSSSENLGQTRNNSTFDVCNSDGNVYYFSADGESVDLGYHSFNRYSDGVITELLQFPTPNGIQCLKVLNDCSGFIFYAVADGSSHFQRGLYYFDLSTNEVTDIDISPYTEYPYQILLFHVDSDFVSENELFVKINDGTGSCTYGILNINNQTITELGIECVTNSGDVSVLSDYSKLALQIDYDQGMLKIYDLPSFNEKYTIDKDLITLPKLIKNKWLD